VQAVYFDWMINNQLGRRNLSKETQSYLRGLQYEREKKKVTDTLKQNKPFHQNEGTGETAYKLAEQHNVSKATIKRDAVYSKAVDTITQNTAPEIKHKILNRGDQLKRRKEIYEIKYPESKRIEKVQSNLKQNADNGIIPPSVVTFTQDTATKIGVSQSTIQKEMQIADKFASKIKAIVYLP